MDPFTEHKRVKTNVHFPLNPAFFKTNKQDRMNLQSVNAFCRTLKVPLNKDQEFEYMTERAAQKYEHYTKELERIVKGYREDEFEPALIAFITSLNFAEMTEAEKELIFSKTMCRTTEGRNIRKIIVQYYMKQGFANMGKKKMKKSIMESDVKDPNEDSQD